MNTKTIVVFAVSFIFGLVLGQAVLPPSFGENVRTRMGWGGGMMGGDSSMSRNIDRHFIEEMIPHHEGAIAMAQIALERSTRPEILSLSQDIIEAQTREINDMKEWYESWFGTPVPVTSQHMMGGVGMVHMGGMTGDTQVLENIASSEFDKEFLNQMIPHHEMAVAMGRMLAASTERSEMQTLAGQIIASQSREIDMMRGWLASW
mgnify:CR=1 FL=1